MYKNLTTECFYQLPSGTKVHPSRLIHKDGTLMWKHALLVHNVPYIPETQAHEQHIIKTAQRLEELNSWVSQDLEIWDSLLPVLWYYPLLKELSEGISVYFKHATLDNATTYDILTSHLQSHETLEHRDEYLYFKRC